MAMFLAAALLAGVAAGSVIAAGTIVLGFSWMAFAGSLIMSGLSRALAKKPQSASLSSSGAGSGGRLVSIRQAIAPRQVIVGECRVGGVITYAREAQDRQLFHMVVTFSGHPIKEFVEIILDGESTGATTFLNTDGYVLFGRWNQPETGRSWLRIRQSLGDDTGQPFPQLVAESEGGWLDTDRQTGCAKLYLRFEANPGIFPNGLPSVTAVIRGALVYDNRTDATAWHHNAALWLSHYFTQQTYGLRADYSAEINDDYLTTAANECDERVELAHGEVTMVLGSIADTINVGTENRKPATGEGVRFTTTGTLPAPLATGTTYYAVRAPLGLTKLATSYANALAGTVIDITDAGTGEHKLVYWDEPRYQANGAFLTAETPQAVVSRLLASMAGSAVNLGDQWCINAGAYHAPTLELTESDLVGPNTVQAHVPSREDANAIKGVFVDPNNAWQPTDFPPIAPASYLTEDGGERRWKDIDLTAFVISPMQAQRLAKIELLKMRQALSESAPFRLRAWGAVPGRTVGRTDAQLGWNNKAFEITSSELVIVEEDEGVTLAVRHSLRETAAAIFDWTTDEEQQLDIAPNTNLPDAGVVGPPGVPAVDWELYETTAGRGVAAKAIVSWGATTYPYGAFYQVEYRVTGVGDYTVLPVTRALELEIPDFAPGRWDFRVKAIGVTGAESDYSLAENQEILGLGAAPETPVIRGLQAVGGLAILTLDPHPALDVRIGGRWRVRHCEDTATPAWETSFSIGEDQGYVGGQTIIVLPLKAGTYLVKAEDFTGHQSDGFAFITSRQASVLTFSPVDDLQEDTTYPGTHSATVAVDNILKLSGAGLIDDAADIDAILDWDSESGVSSEGTYTFSAGFDFGLVMAVRVTGQIEGFTENVNDRIDDRTGMIDAWLDFDGSGGGGSTDAFLEARETDDNPTGTPTWSEWGRLDAGEYNCWGMEFRLQIRSYDPAYNQTIEILRVKAEEVV